MNKIKAGIVGAAGYTGGEMLRILLNHPQVELYFVLSNSSAGKPVFEIHRDLLGETEICFDAEMKDGADVIFLCVGHGDAIKFINEHSFSPDVKIIDLSQDFRLEKEKDHSTSKRSFVYGLPELNREEIKSAFNIANPGCFATAIQLALLPLAFHKLLKNEIQVSAITGSTGAGQSLSPTSHFSWRENNLSVYKAFSHQHLNEINQSVRTLQPEFDNKINFIPYRGDFTRGIIASVYMHCDSSIKDILAYFHTYYEGHPFAWVSDEPVDLKQVINTNKAFLSLEKKDDMLLIVSVLDNLVKGASGQAVQNMNLLFGLREDEGLRLKGIAF